MFMFVVGVAVVLSTGSHVHWLRTRFVLTCTEW
jgi:hypothetical protein